MRNMSFRSLFAVTSVLVTAVVLGSGLFLWYGAKSGRGLSISLEVPDEVSVGIPFELRVSVANESGNVLEDAKLTVEIPEGVVFVGSDPEKNFLNKAFGALGSGSLAEETFDLIALGGERSVKEVRATVSYLPESLRSRFEKSAAAQFVVASVGIEVDVSVPERVFGGEEFAIVFAYANRSDVDVEDVELNVAYPPSFRFKSASLDPDEGNGVWELGDLRRGSEGEITVRGSLIGPDNAFFEIGAILEARFLGRSYPIAEKVVSIAIAPSPLSLAISTDRDSAYLAKEGDTIRYTLRFSNHTDVALHHLTVSARLTGVMFDLATLSTNASLRTSDNTLIWNVANTPSLSVFTPGASSEVNFQVKLKDPYPIRRLSDKNFILKVDGEVGSPTVPSPIVAERTLGIASHEIKVGGKVSIDAQGFFRDANAGIVNKGPWPPQAGKSTNFTIHWILKNFSTDIEDVEVKAFLGGNVRMTSVTKSNTADAPTYNPTTQEVVWKVASLNAGKGVLGVPAEAIFQLEATPSINQAGSGVILLQPTSLTAKDLFTGEELSASDAEVKTTSLTDSTVRQDEGNVLP